MAKIRMAHASRLGQQIFTHGRFPEVGQKQKTEKNNREERKRPNDGNNDGQLRIVTPPRVAHAKLPRPTMASFASVHHYVWHTQAG